MEESIFIESKGNLISPNLNVIFEKVGQQWVLVPENYSSTTNEEVFALPKSMHVSGRWEGICKQSQEEHWLHVLAVVEPLCDLEYRGFVF